MARHRLLIIDDDRDFSQMVVDYFRAAGYEMSLATNMEDAVNIFRRQKPRVVFLDFNMPIVTGEKMMPVLQSIDPAVRVIVVSGYTQEEVEEKFKGLGYFAYFEKAGLSLENLKRKVEEALNY